MLCPVLVQGENAAPQLINAVNLFNEYDLADVIIIGRGGGSIEDLWPFNDENLAYAIYASNIPMISAVGHETDFTICDFVCDLRAPTPSAAAELCVPDREELRAYYQSQRQYLSSIMDRKLIDYRSRLDNCKARVDARSPKRLLKEYEQKLSALAKSAENSINAQCLRQTEGINGMAAKLEALNPLAVLRRGYAVAEKDHSIINSVKELKENDIVKLTFRDGQAMAELKEIEEN